MRNVALAALLLVVATLTAGCPLAPSCGGFEGGGNRVYQRTDSEMLILCENGGFVATLTDRMVEGTYLDNGDGTGIATNGEDGQLAFDAQFNPDSTLTTPQLGDTPWTWMDLSPTALDHSNSLCQDLQYRSWWTAQ